MERLERLMTEPEYRALPHISYSALAGVDKSPANLLKTMEMTESMIYGSAVDVLAFDGEDEFNNKFALMDYKAPSDKVQAIVNSIYEDSQSWGESFLLQDAVDDLLSDTIDDKILKFAKQHEYGTGGKYVWKDETIIRKVKEEGNEYFKFLKHSEGKMMLDASMNERARNSVNTLYTHDFTQHYFNEYSGIEIYPQFPIVWKYGGKDCKSLLDILKIDHNKKKIYPIDLKTSFDDVMYFPYNYIKWRYYIQAAFYTKAVQYFKMTVPELFNYTVEPFKFIVISSQNPYKPLVYNTTLADLYNGEYGGKLQNGNEIRGFKQLIIDMEWHKEKELYQYPKEVYDKNGHLELNVWEK